MKPAMRQQRRLPAAGGAQRHHEVAGVERKVDIGKREVVPPEPA